ncbi:hypothetical protein F5050DRAFT_520868 [Lentinula boryana]|uniref:Uncharacterized protein n=1 Tax=Lentinula boryana TaxID=40481 RepID=A0ABQ8Q788_9AGAR|nr:hypothetical protein F5050DRAFT_520868 [Lentinula boryana]
MRISTTFLIFGLASVVAAAPHPVSEQLSIVLDILTMASRAQTFPAAQATVTRDIDNDLSMLGRDVPLIHARGKGPKDNTESESEDNQNVVIKFSPKGAEGVVLKQNEQAEVVSLIKKNMSPDLEPTFPHQPQRFDQLKTEIAPGSKPDQIITFTFYDQKNCKGSCTGHLNFRTRTCNILDANKKPVTTKTKSSTRKQNSNSTQRFIWCGGSTALIDSLLKKIESASTALKP